MLMFWFPGSFDVRCGCSSKNKQPVITRYAQLAQLMAKCNCKDPTSKCAPQFQIKENSFMH